MAIFYTKYSLDSRVIRKDNADFEPVASGTLIHHAPYQPHAIRTHNIPLLALWSWTGNLSNDTYSFVVE